MPTIANGGHMLTIPIINRDFNPECAEGAETGTQR